MQGSGEIVSSAAAAASSRRNAGLGIRSKLFVVSLALIGASLLASEVYLTRSLEAQWTEGIREDLLVRARLVAEQVAARAGAVADVRTLDALADHLGTAASGRVTLVRPDGTVVGDSEVPADALARLDNHRARPEIAQALAAREGVGVRLSRTVQERMMYVAVPIEREDAVIGAARVAVRLDRIDALVSDLRKTLTMA